MNEQLPPVDSNVRAHLARRSAGRLPEGLAESVASALDRGAEEPRGGAVARVIGPHLRWTTPRLAGAGLAVALVAILVVAIGVPALRGRPAIGPASFPAGYPADRALTTAELTAGMAGPALPKYTPLVATVTIDIRTDICPMNPYPTVGVIEDAGSQICVIEGGQEPRLSGTTAAGTFAFRYVAPGYLGLLGEITPASDSRLAFDGAGNWPIDGETFLVEAWLQKVGPTCGGSASGVTPDPLDPAAWRGHACDYFRLADDPSAKESFSALGGFLESAGEKQVKAETMIPIDMRQAAENTPHGVYVVRGFSERCPDASATAQVRLGCGHWTVLAKVPNITAPEPSPSASPSPADSAAASQSMAPASLAASGTDPSAPAPAGVLGTGNRPLTEAEFAALWASDPTHLEGRIAILKGPVPPALGCHSWAAAAPAPSQTCGTIVFEGQIGADGHYWAVHVGAEGKLSIVGEVATPSSGYVFTLDQLNAATELKDGDLVMVQGWLLESMTTCNSDISPLPSACGPYSEIDSTASDNSPAGIGVQRGAYQQITGTTGDPMTEGPPVYGIFLVRVSNPDSGTVLASLAATAAP